MTNQHEHRYHCMLLTVFAVALIPATIGYNVLLARYVAPRIKFLPTPIAITILGTFATLPWLMFAAAVAWVWY